MSVYVDEAVWPFGRMLMCHMMADTPEELHNFAARLGMKREWFQDKDRFPHYDISKGKRAQAIRMGAIAISAQEMVTWALARDANTQPVAEETR